jgi:hypothetical protein
MDYAAWWEVIHFTDEPRSGGLIDLHTPWVWLAIITIFLFFIEIVVMLLRGGVK